MKRPVFSLLLASALLAVAAPGWVAGAETPPPDDPLDTVYVDSAVIHLPSGGPAEGHLVVSGSVPTPCHLPVFEVEHSADEVRVWLWSLLETDAPCVATLEAVELIIPLGVIDADTTVLLEGEPVTEVMQAGSGSFSKLVGAGWSFGMCLGYCAADLELDGADAVLMGHDRDQEGPIFENTGVLTAEGLERVADVTEGLDSSSLEPVYGCPDCADGGASYLSLRVGDVVSRHEMDYGAPPESLAAVQQLADEIMGALEVCTSNQVISVASDCRPQLADPV